MQSKMHPILKYLHFQKGLRLFFANWKLVLLQNDVNVCVRAHFAFANCWALLQALCRYFSAFSLCVCTDIQTNLRSQWPRETPRHMKYPTTFIYLRDLVLRLPVCKLCVLVSLRTRWRFLHRRLNWLTSLYGRKKGINPLFASLVWLSNYQRLKVIARFYSI